MVTGMESERKEENVRENCERTNSDLFISTTSINITCSFIGYYISRAVLWLVWPVDRGRQG